MAGATRRFSKEAEIKTKFEVIFFHLFMFYCLFVLNYRNISLTDYLSVVFYVYVTNYSQYAKQKKMAGATPLSPTCVHIRVYVCVCTYMHMRVCMCVRVCICVCVHVRVGVRTTAGARTYTTDPQPVARWQHVARDTVFCCPRRHL